MNELIWFAIALAAFLYVGTALGIILGIVLENRIDRYYDEKWGRLGEE